VIILAWVYYSALHFFFGAELTLGLCQPIWYADRPAPRALALGGDRAAQGLLRTAEIEALAKQQNHET